MVWSAWVVATLLVLATAVEVRSSLPLSNGQLMRHIERTDKLPNTTAVATVSTNDLTLVMSDHGNATVTFYLRGHLETCVNFTFTYDPSDPSINPLEGFIICQSDLDDLDLMTQDGSREVTLWPLPDNVTFDIVSRRVGKTIIGLQADPPVVDVTDAFLRVAVIRDPVLDVVSDVFGWTYSIVWDISFLPQVWLNWNRKSVIGFSFDNVTLNILAYLCYSIFNISFFAVPFVQTQFHERYPRQVNHVRPNDVFFATYALFIEIVLGIQCFIYQREPGQRVSKACWALVAASIVSVAIASILAAVSVIWWLDVFYLMSYLKLVITPLKYIPQLYVNYRHRSTAGFSMVGLLMDFTGGIMSLAQMFMLAANNDDWISVFNNFSKFGLGVLTIIFDLMFFVQHYFFHLRKK